MPKVTKTEILQLIASKPCERVSQGRWREMVVGIQVNNPVVDYCKNHPQLCGSCEARKFLFEKGIPYTLLPDECDSLTANPEYPIEDNKDYPVCPSCGNRENIYYCKGILICPGFKDSSKKIPPFTGCGRHWTPSDKNV